MKIRAHMSPGDSVVEDSHENKKVEKNAKHWEETCKDSDEQRVAPAERGLQLTNDYHHDDYVEGETELSCRIEAAIGICCVVIETR